MLNVYPIADIPYIQNVWERMAQNLQYSRRSYPKRRQRRRL